MEKLMLLSVLTLADVDSAAQFGRFGRLTTTVGAELARHRWTFLVHNVVPDAVGFTQMADAKWRLDCWQTLHHVRGLADNDGWLDKSNPEIRNGHIAHLRLLIGEKNFKAGVMPSCLPCE